MATRVMMRGELGPSARRKAREARKAEYDAEIRRRCFALGA